MLANIPDEILLKIFIKISTKHLLLSVALVSKQFHRISKDPSLLKLVILENIDKYVYDSVENLLKNSTKIETLIIKGSVLKKDHLLSIALQTSKVLKTIKIEDKFCHNMAKVLLDLGQNLEYLDLSGSIGNSKYEIIFTSNMKNLKSIKYYGLDQSFNSEHVKSISTNCHNLKQIFLPNIDSFSNELMENFCAKMKSLQSLSLHAHTKLEWNFKALTCLKYLTDLRISLYNLVLNKTQIENLAQISQLKTFCFKYSNPLLVISQDEIQGTKMALKNMFCNLNMINLEALMVHITCNTEPLDIYKLLIKKIGIKLKTLTLTCSDGFCMNLCPKIENLSVEDVKEIFEQASKLSHLNIVGQDLPEEFLCEIEYKYKTKIVVDHHKSKAMRRFQTFNPKFFENMTYL